MRLDWRRHHTRTASPHSSWRPPPNQRRQQEISDHEEALKIEADELTVQTSKKNKKSKKDDKTSSDSRKKAAQGQDGKQEVCSDEEKLNEENESAQLGALKLVKREKAMGHW